MIVPPGSNGPPPHAPMSPLPLPRHPPRPMAQGTVPAARGDDADEDPEAAECQFRTSADPHAGIVYAPPGWQRRADGKAGMRAVAAHAEPLPFPVPHDPPAPSPPRGRSKGETAAPFWRLDSLPRRLIAAVAAFALLPLVPALLALLTEFVALGAGCARDMPCAILGADAGILLRASLREAWFVVSIFSFGGIVLWLVPVFATLHRKIGGDRERLAVAAGLAAILAAGLIAVPLLVVGIGSVGSCAPDAAGVGLCPLWGVEMGAVFHASAMVLLAPLLGASAIVALAIYPLVGLIVRRLLGPPG